MSKEKGEKVLDDKLDWRPLGGRVYVRVLGDVDTKTPGGILLPDTGKPRPQRGKVLAAGPGRTTDYGIVIPMPVKAGDVVLFGISSGVVIEGDKTLRMVEADEIIAVLPERQ